MEDQVIRVDDEDIELTDEDLNDEFEPEAPTYEVWAIGYYHNEITDVEILLNSFTNHEEAVNYANSVHMGTIKAATTDISTKHVDTFSIEVETVVADEDGNTENVGTIYKIELVA